MNRRYKKSAGRLVDTNPFNITTGVTGATALGGALANTRTNVFSFTIQTGHQCVLDPGNKHCQVLVMPYSVAPAFLNCHIEVFVDQADGGKSERVFDGTSIHMNPAWNISADISPRLWRSYYIAVPGDILRVYVTPGAVAMSAADSYINLTVLSTRMYR